MTTITTREHLHDRPRWNCCVCGRPWPCDDAKARLLDEYRNYPSLLKVYLSAHMYEALDDLMAQGQPTQDLHERFLAWAHRKPATS